MIVDQIAKTVSVKLKVSDGGGGGVCDYDAIHYV